MSGNLKFVEEIHKNYTSSLIVFHITSCSHTSTADTHATEVYSHNIFLLQHVEDNPNITSKNILIS